MKCNELAFKRQSLEADNAVNVDKEDAASMDAILDAKRITDLSVAKGTPSLRAPRT